MKNLLKVVSVLGLLLTAVPAFLVLNGQMTWEMHSQFMLVGMILWFSSAPFWMKVDR